MKFKVCNDVVEAVEAAEERKAAEQQPIALPVELIAGRGVRGWYTQREEDRPGVSRRTAPGRWSGAAPDPRLAEAVERALQARGR